MASLTFLGAAGTVTGSKHLVQAGRSRILLDCGLFQGPKELRLRNWDGHAEQLRGVDAIVLSHAHLDHTGYLPRLVQRGYHGPIYATPPTIELLGLVLPDAAYLQEEEAEYANRKGYTRHRPALPLFTVEDALATLRLLRPLPFNRPKKLPGGVTVHFEPAGHLLGASSVTLDVGGRRLVFSGDLGRYGQDLLDDPTPLPRADVLVMESTYGGRQHVGNPLADLADAVRAAERGRGALVMPAFALGRTQDLLIALARLHDQGQLPDWPVYVDSPMAVDASAIFDRFPDDHRGDRPDGHLRTPPHTVFARTQTASRRINDRQGEVIIISASGMATGGRILHHLRQRLPDPRNVVLFAGFQAPGTRGRTLLDGANELKMFGELVPVRAAIRRTDGFSAHGDQDELLRWLRGFEAPPEQIYLVHGEPEAAAALGGAIREQLGWTVRPAEDGETVSLGGGRTGRPRSA